MRRLIIAVTLLLATGVRAQDISWKTSDATLPKAQYTLHVSRDGDLYAYSQTPYRSVHRYAGSAGIWSKVTDGELYKLQVISDDLGFALESDTQMLVKFSDNFTKRIILEDNVSGKPIEARDYAIGPDTTIYAIPTDRNLIIRSKDLGESWDTLPASLGMVYQGIDIDAQNTIYAWNAEAVRSTDGGVTWETIYYFHKGDAVAKCMKVGENILVLTQNGILYSGFDTLAVVPKPFLFGLLTGALLEQGPSLSLFYHPTNGYAMYSSDSGRHWDTLRNNGQPFAPSPSIACDSSGIVYIAPYDHSEANYIYSSTDNGASWRPLTQLFDYFTFIGSDPDSAIYSKHSNGIYTSTSDGRVWEKDGPPGVRLIYSTSMTNDGELLAVCRNDDNDVVLASRRDYGTPWSYTSSTPFQDAITPYLASGRFPSGELWTVDAEGYFSVLETDGTWRNAFVLDVPDNVIVTAGIVNSTTIVVTGYEVIYRSTDKGKTFRRVFDLQKEEQGRVVASNFNRCYVLTDNNRLLHSTDQGLTWQLFATPQGGQFTDIVVLPTEALFLSTTSRVFMNKSGFSNPFVWEDVSEKLKGLNVVNLALRGTHRLYAGMLGGNVYFTDLPGSSVDRSTDASDASLVYPNPAQDRCYLTGVDETAIVEMYDLLGTRVLHTLYQGQLDVSELPAGVYQIVVHGNTEQYQTSFIISK